MLRHAQILAKEAVWRLMLLAMQVCLQRCRVVLVMGFALFKCVQSDLAILQ
jgi:hypothetical protein